AFFKLHLTWFREWGLEELLLSLLKEYPLLPPALATLAFRKARTRKEEGAELHVSEENGRSAVVAMRPERFEADHAVASLLRHEFMHLSDMVNPAFGYSRELNLPGIHATQQRITRERYRVLWDITIDGRLANAGRSDASGQLRAHHEAIFHRAFFWSEEKRCQVFESHWNNPSPRHADLIALAADPRDLSHANAPVPGSLCPLCQFPTFDWANLAEVSPQALERLRAEFPRWTPAQGACARCVEIYELAGRFELPATVLL